MDSNSSSSSSDESSSSSNSIIDDYQDSPFDFVLNDDGGGGDDQAERDDEGISNNDNDDDGGFSSAAESLSSMNQPKSEGDLFCSQNDDTCTIGSITSSPSIYNNARQSVLPSQDGVLFPASSATSTSFAIPHRGSLRRILNPSSFHIDDSLSNNATIPSSRAQGTKSSSWPMYAIDVATENSISQCTQQMNINENNATEDYQIIFDRQQYEFCTRLFALLDTESQSVIGPECIQEFICLHCPVVRRRDDAIFALRYKNEDAHHGERKKVSILSSPTFDEIWERTIHSDTQCIISSDKEADLTTHRIGIEGWMVFCRLLSLAQHQENQRRFASRHLQQMMRHKHGGAANRLNPNEIIVMVDNPPPEPPSLVSVRSLVEIEKERATSHSNECIQGWPFCPLPLPELDLDHCLVSTFSNNQRLSRLQHQSTRRVSIEPFSSSQEGDFIVRFRMNDDDDSTMLVRRSYLDFEWLNSILKLHKRPGQGHLCGRILPPFPSRQGGFYQQRTKGSTQSSVSSSSHQQDISERAISVAKSGVGIITSMAKSVWSGYLSGSSPSSTYSSTLSKNKPGQGAKMKSSAQWSSSKQGDDPAEMAQKIERYLNYLLENDALSSSFPLNAILQASQSGLESTKQILQDHTKNKKQHSSNLATTASSSRDGPYSAASIFSALVSRSSTTILRLQGDDDTSWLRAAATVAMALQFHGILETTGHESTSAKIQHASLPKFRNAPMGSWDEDESGNDKVSGKRSPRRLGSVESDSPKSEANFEVGVVNVESELADDEQDIGGYDLLPSPGPSEEHRVLNAGSDVSGKGGPSKSHRASKSRFVYETTSDSQSNEISDKKDAVLGSIRVDNDIDKLRDIIRSIRHTLGKLHHSGALIQSAQDERNIIQLDILRNMDSWGDTGDEIISQRALVNGVAALESYNNVVEESNKTMADDLSWQSLLASSAVDAVTEVRGAVRASSTASRAKSAAYIAAEKAKKAYEACDHTSSKEKVQHTQSEASKAQSHAIHATVVDHTANIAKKRSAVSLAQDVKSWNLHRKNEMLRTCIQFAKSQQEASRKAADAWESLKEGLIDSTTCLFAKDEVGLWANQTVISSQAHPSSAPADDFFTTSSRDVVSNSISSGNKLEGSSDWEQTSRQDFSECVDAEAASNFLSSSKQSQQSELGGSSSGNVYCLAPPSVNEDYFSFHQSIASEEENSDTDKDDNSGYDDNHKSYQSENDDDSQDELTKGDPMSTSMQSLIDGLMSWGEQENAEESPQSDILGTSHDAQYKKLLG